MRAFISHETALAYWREHFPLDSELGRPARVSKSQAYAYRKEDVLACVPEWYIIEGQPVDVLVFDASLRRKSKQVESRLWGTVVPSGAFYRDGDIYVSSPEFVFLQMASRITLVQLVALGCELCGTYVLLPKDRTHPGAIDDYPKRRDPLTSVKRLQAFVEKAVDGKGRTQALRALRYVAEASRSPMETMTYMLLCLPPMIGGYGLPKPIINAHIDLDDEGKAIARRSYCEGDICWQKEKLNIEYHGEVHVGAQNMKRDVGRTLGIEHMGYRVITVTSMQVFDMVQFEVVAVEAAKHLKKRLYPQALGNTLARSTLHEELEAWMFK